MKFNIVHSNILPRKKEKKSHSIYVWFEEEMVVQLFDFKIASDC